MVKIAYIVSRFPNLPETFILREMVTLEEQGWEIALYPLIFQSQTVLHPEAQAWLSRAHRLAWLSFDILWANLRRFVRDPFLYLSLWGQVLWGHLKSPKLLVRSVLLFPKIVRMAELMSQEGIAHIHAHYATHPAFAAWLIHRLTGLSYSVTVHAHDIYVDHTMLATKLRPAAFVVAISEYNREYLSTILGAWVRSNTHVIRCGVNTSYYTPRASIYQHVGRFEIISVGSLEVYKGHRYLIEACSILRARNVPFACRIIGDGNLRQDLKKSVDKQGLNEYVRFLGSMPQNEVARLLPTAHCYVHPSVIAPSGKMEGIPVAIMEAMACALPVVATSISGVPELIRDGETGWLVYPEDPLSLSKALEYVYANPEEAQRRAQSGRQFVLRNYELSSNVSELASLFSKVATGADT
jgi:colanic acid/amylovoran biosynthesis glycosyltransferase